MNIENMECMVCEDNENLFIKNHNYKIIRCAKCGTEGNVSFFEIAPEVK